MADHGGGTRRSEPPSRRGATGRRRRRGREPVVLWWGAFAAVPAAAWLLGSWRLALLGLLVWCLYEFLLVPAVCRVATRQGHHCREPVRGRLFACTRKHQEVKNEALWRLVGMRNPVGPRRTPADQRAARDTGVVVYSPAVRGRLERTDRITILLAALGTLVATAGMIYGFGR